MQRMCGQGLHAMAGLRTGYFGLQTISLLFQLFKYRLQLTTHETAYGGALAEYRAHHVVTCT